MENMHANIDPVAGNDTVLLHYMYLLFGTAY